MASAASSLGYARSTVTGHIQSLERSLGTRLFVRAGDGWLTSAGSTLLPHAESVLEGVDRARQAVKACDQRSPALNVGVTESLAEYRLPMLLRTLTRLLPGLKAEVRTGTPAELERQVLTGALHVALANSISDEKVLRTDEVGRRRLWEENVVLVGGPSLRGTVERVLTTREGCVYRTLTEQDFLPRLPHAEMVQVGSLSGVKASALSGMGVGLLPMTAAKAHLHSGQLVELPLRTPRTVVTDVVWNQRQCPSAVTVQLQRLRPAAAVVAATAA